MNKRIYFASDFHLGIDVKYTSREREHQLVCWLDSIKEDALEIYLVGDIFDFWFEYKTVVPKGYTRFLGKLAELRDAGIPIYFFTGNHDMWMFKYFETEFGIPIYRKPIQRNLLGKNFFIGHGDGLGPGDHGYKFWKKIFTNPLCQWAFHRLHPNLGIGLATRWSGKSRDSHAKEDAKYLGEQEWLLAYANKKLGELPDTDFFVFGHRHLPINIMLKNQKSRYINLGDWMNHNSYGVWDGKMMEIHFFENSEGKVYPS